MATSDYCHIYFFYEYGTRIGGGCDVSALPNYKLSSAGLLDLELGCYNPRGLVLRLIDESSHNPQCHTGRTSPNPRQMRLNKPLLETASVYFYITYRNNIVIQLSRQSFGPRVLSCFVPICPHQSFTMRIRTFRVPYTAHPRPRLLESCHTVSMAMAI